MIDSEKNRSIGRSVGLLIDSFFYCFCLYLSLDCFVASIFHVFYAHTFLHQVLVPNNKTNQKVREILSNNELHCPSLESSIVDRRVNWPSSKLYLFLKGICVVIDTVVYCFRLVSSSLLLWLWLWLLLFFFCFFCCCCFFHYLLCVLTLSASYSV